MEKRESKCGSFLFFLKKKWEEKRERSWNWRKCGVRRGVFGVDT
jgi:hypothetical protein